MKQFIELQLAESNRNVLIALEDILDVIEVTTGWKQIKAVQIYTQHKVTYTCNISCYELLKRKLIQGD